VSQRNSGYERRADDDYQTPEWATLALVPHLPARARKVTILEAAAGSGKMVAALRGAGFSVERRDRSKSGNDYDFLFDMKLADAVITNPPFKVALEFIEHALALTRKTRGFCAFLLRVDYDSAATRQHLFGGCRQFAKKLVLTKRIVWFENGPASPSSNHTWYLWDHRHAGRPIIAYAPVGP
jgi:hypothetical protein